MRSVYSGTENTIPFALLNMAAPAHQQNDLAFFDAVPALGAIDHRSCHVRSVEIQPGLSLHALDLRVTKLATVSSETFPAACLSVVLDGYGEGRTSGLDAGFRPDEVWVSSTSERISLRKVISPVRPVRTVELVVTPAWLDYAERRFGDDQAFDGIRAAVQRTTATHRRPLDARLREIAWAIQRQPESGAMASLFLESRALDLLALLAAEFQAASPIIHPKTLASRALDRIVAVKEKIDSDPSVVTTIAALASEFSVSPSKLKKDFSAAFGIGLGKYIVERRLLLGREFIEAHSISVSEAAYRIGYAHPANFTAAFRRRFGYPPSAIKRIS